MAQTQYQGQTLWLAQCMTASSLQVGPLMCLCVSSAPVFVFTHLHMHAHTHIQRYKNTYKQKKQWQLMLITTVSARIPCNFGEMEHGNKQTSQTTWALISHSWICMGVCIHLYKCRLPRELMNHTVCRSMWWVSVWVCVYFNSTLIGDRWKPTRRGSAESHA